MHIATFRSDSYWHQK